MAPQLSTIAESGIAGFEIDVWHGAMAPAATPPDIVARLRSEFVKMLTQPDFKERMLAAGFEPVGDPPDKFAAYLRVEVEKWSKVVRRADIRID